MAAIIAQISLAARERKVSKHFRCRVLTLFQLENTEDSRGAIRRLFPKRSCRIWDRVLLDSFNNMAFLS